MSGIGKQLRGSGIAKSGFKSKHDVVSHERKRYADGPDQKGVQPDRNEAQQKAYDEIHSQAEKERSDISSRRQKEKNDDVERSEKELNDTYKQRLKKYEDEKTYYHDRDSTVGPKVNKFLAKYIADPVTYVADKLLPENKRASRWDEADRKARKDVLGYKKGGSANWIQGAIKKPGSLRKTLGVKAGQKIPAAKLSAAAKKSGITGRRARLAITLKGLKKWRS